MTPEEAVRAYFSAYSEGNPEKFDQVVSQNYLDYGMSGPGDGDGHRRAEYRGLSLYQVAEGWLLRRAMQ
jgi:hypothetical protein